MAGRIRQPINIQSFEEYLKTNVPEIKTPLDVKQASLQDHVQDDSRPNHSDNSSAMARVIQHTS